MGTKQNQLGFSAVELIIVVVIVSLLGYAGFTVYSRQQDKKANDTNQVAEQSAVADDVPSAPEVNSTEDLTTAQNTLNQTNLDDTSDSSRLDTEMSAF